MNFQVIYLNANGDSVLVSRISAADKAAAKELVTKQAAFGQPEQALQKGACRWRLVPLD